MTILIDNKKSILKLILGLSLSSTILIVSYGLAISAIRHDAIIGQSFIDTEIPPPTYSPIYFKPATLLMISSIILWYCIMEVSKAEIRRLSNAARSLYFLAAFLLAAVTLYELIYNFMLWSTILSSQSATSFNPDKATNAFPNDKYQVSLVFATKVGTTILVCSLYSLYLLREKGERTN